MTIQQNQISIQNQQINNQQQQINSLIMGSQDVDSLTPSPPPPMAEPKEKMKKPEPEVDKPAGLKKVNTTPTGQVQRIQLTKNSQVKQQPPQLPPQAKDRAREQLKSTGDTSGSSSSGEELEVVYNSSKTTPTSQATKTVQSHKLEVKKMSAVTSQAGAASMMQQQGPLTVVR